MMEQFANRQQAALVDMQRQHETMLRQAQEDSQRRHRELQANYEAKWEDMQNEASVRHIAAQTRTDQLRAHQPDPMLEQLLEAVTQLCDH